MAGKFGNILRRKVLHFFRALSVHFQSKGLYWHGLRMHTVSRRRLVCRKSRANVVPTFHQVHVLKKQNVMAEFRCLQNLNDFTHDLFTKYSRLRTCYHEMINKARATFVLHWEATISQKLRVFLSRVISEVRCGETSDYIRLIKGLKGQNCKLRKLQNFDLFRREITFQDLIVMRRFGLRGLILASGPHSEITPSCGEFRKDAPCAILQRVLRLFYD